MSIRAPLAPFPYVGNNPGTTRMLPGAEISRKCALADALMACTTSTLVTGSTRQPPSQVPISLHLPTAAQVSPGLRLRSGSRDDGQQPTTGGFQCNTFGRFPGSASDF
jgi:hypothetical protein